MFIKAYSHWAYLLCQYYEYENDQMFFKSDNYQGFNQSNKAGEFSPYKLWKEYEMQSKS